MVRAAGESWDVCLPGDPRASRGESSESLRKTYRAPAGGLNAGRGSIGLGGRARARPAARVGRGTRRRRAARAAAAAARPRIGTLCRSARGSVEVGIPAASLQDEPTTPRDLPFGTWLTTLGAILQRLGGDGLLGLPNVAAGFTEVLVGHGSGNDAARAKWCRWAHLSRHPRPTRGQSPGRGGRAAPGPGPTPS